MARPRDFTAYVNIAGAMGHSRASGGVFHSYSITEDLVMRARLLLSMLAGIALFAGTVEIAGAQTPDSCLTLTPPEFQGFSNPDSILYDTCSGVEPEDRYWARRTWWINFDVHAFLVSDSTEFGPRSLSVDDLDAAYSAIRDSFLMLEEKYGPIEFVMYNLRKVRQGVGMRLSDYARLRDVNQTLDGIPNASVVAYPEFICVGSVPNDRGMKPNLPWDSILFLGSNPFWPRHHHRLGWLWNLYRQNLPMAWEITRGRRSVVIGFTDDVNENPANISDHPDLGHHRIIDSAHLGDGPYHTIPIIFGHPVSTISNAAATGDDDSVRGRSMVGTCPECATVLLSDGNRHKPDDVDLDSTDNEYFEHIAVWNQSVQTPDINEDILSIRERELRNILTTGIVAVMLGGNDVSVRPWGRRYGEVVEGDDTIIVYRSSAMWRGAVSVMDSSDPARDVKAIAVGAVFDGTKLNRQCDFWDDTTSCFGGAHFDGDVESFPGRWALSIGSEKFNIDTNIETRRERKARAFMDITAGTGTLAAIDGPVPSPADSARFGPDFTGTSHSAPQVSGIVGLMLSVNRYMGVTVERDSTGKVVGAFDVQRRVNNALTFTADKVPDNSTVDTARHYILHKVGCQTIIVDGKCVDSCASIDTLETYRYLQTNPDSTPIQYAYVRQTNDPLNRSWAQRMGFGRVNAYRAVAHAIPLKGDYAYTTSATLSIDDTTSMNENRMRLIHFGAWRDALVRVMDSGGVAVPGGDTAHRNMGVTMINGVGTTITVPDSLILAIDGILTTDNPTGNNTITATGNGKVLLWGYLEDVEVVGNTRIGDLTIVGSDTNTVGCVAVGQSWIDAEQYGTVTLKDHGVYLLNRGTMTMYPGAEIAMTGSRDLTITDGATLNMKEATRITRSGTQKVVVDSGSTLRIAVDGIAEIDCEVLVREGGRLLIDTGAMLSLRRFTVERGGELAARPGSRLVLTDEITNVCEGRLDLVGTATKRVTVTGRTAPCCDEACTTVVAPAFIYAYDNPSDPADKTECYMRIAYADVSNALIVSRNAHLYPVFGSTFSANRDILWSSGTPLLYAYLDTIFTLTPYNPADTFPRREVLDVSSSRFEDEEGEFAQRDSATYSVIGIRTYGLQRVRSVSNVFERLRVGLDVKECDSAEVRSCSLDVVNTGILSTASNLWYCSNHFHSVDAGVATSSTLLARGYTNEVDVSFNAIAPFSSSFHYLRGNTFKDFGNFGVWIRSTPVVENNRILKKLPEVIEVLGRNVDTLTETDTTFGHGNVDRYLQDKNAWLSIRCGFNRYAEKTQYHLAAGVNKTNTPIQIHNNEFLDTAGHRVRKNVLVDTTGAPNDTSESIGWCTMVTSNEGCTISNPSQREPWDKAIEPEYLHDGRWLDSTTGIAFFDTALAVNRAAFLDTSAHIMTRRVAMFNALAAAIFGDSTVPKLTVLALDLDVLAKDTTDQDEVRSGALIVRGLALERLGSDSAARASYMKILENLPDAGDSIAANWSRLRLQAEEFDPVDEREEHDSAMTVYYDRVLEDLRRVPEEYAPKRTIPPATPGQPLKTTPSLTFSLGQNIPNPYRRETLIPFTLTRPMSVRLVVIDARGNQVGVVVQGDLRAGNHQATFFCGNLPAGTYFYSLETDDGRQTLPMTIEP